MEVQYAAGVNEQRLQVHMGDAVVCRKIGKEKSIDRYHCVANYQIRAPHELFCTHVVHYTEYAFAKLIGLLATDDPFKFKAESYCYSTDSSCLNLSWWSPLPPPNWEAVVQNNLLPYPPAESGNSAAFRGESLCGPVGFIVSWKGILQQYAISRRKRYPEDVEFRIVGTFRYSAEIMYVVLVCIRG